ncbi:ImmA/IrrE family metallo-endopeptidase [Corynebacterium pygosceleis]|uniref:ImmA/IrrE family metallo-endopeptidase n=1 Tax=Corynebacterium pygosceleis TaxID=2800406 RepID=UPI00200391EC|nr:ImmA/IrrE family metallo-endopeptidase [Corynebacterium pygosceleis]MCK7676200.1 ImmA/IrrE family metallo-endopeptidase [Corynebacterium pygosceleis]
MTIAEVLGSRVVVLPLRDGVSGMIDKAPDDEQAVIYINSEDGAARQRFTLAHEIGHLVERQRVSGYDSYTFKDFRRPNGKYRLHEFFADEFAGELLMPDFEFMTDLIDNDFNYYATAARFGVTVAEVEKRSERLRDKPPVETNVRQ